MGYRQRKNALINNENGFYVKKLSLHAGGEGPVVLVDDINEAAWKFI